jgi:hypothetical protein
MGFEFLGSYDIVQFNVLNIMFGLGRKAEMKFDEAIQKWNSYILTDQLVEFSTGFSLADIPLHHCLNT